MSSSEVKTQSNKSITLKTTTTTSPTTSKNYNKHHTFYVLDIALKKSSNKQPKPKLFNLYIIFSPIFIQFQLPWSFRSKRKIIQFLTVDAESEKI
jgi:hypothetical protein